MGIYIHIPFCKQACHYCDFHFSTSLKKRADMIEAICKELFLRKDELEGPIETIYFGGGTPSLLTSEEIQQIFDSIYKYFKVIDSPEVTLEANPDDLSIERIREIASSPVNRLSIGIQSFFEQDLKLMNRAHNAKEATACISEVKKHFDNYSIDLIYGIPEMSEERWNENLDKALEFDVPHLSCYALTVEPRTALKKFIEKGLVPPVSDELAQSHHQLLVETLETHGYENYEFSNFGKPGYFSRNNMAYWHGKPYLGIGPSAHSYDGDVRKWNIANNTKYIKAITEGSLAVETERLSKRDKYNEYIMTRLRTATGVVWKEVEASFGKPYFKYLGEQAQPHLESHLLFSDGEILKVTKKGKFLTDGIAADLFLVNLES
ncbi:radical SAM family heme chaperone HemW [Aureitalea sp. L0-47]|uniref:radical SAM family heme chaperone HemW n=1 Tax=Aureitalea sp. L0-47 TaxID=2816962 RepID=UPI002237C63B|nr:radical SAM family heme chaperone HemW [Aureitalea sp. L0-47]MCW5518575.1 radical SAM family heme chaperone HemW [Aureitalea sp. L0-47]